MTTSAERIWTIGELLNWTAGFLAQKGMESPRLDAEILLAKTLGCKKIDLYGMYFGESASEELRQQYREMIQQRVDGCPAAYLVGRKDFFSLEFDVNSAVLIPRPDTETLVTVCLDLAKKIASPRILDIGTGSGNLAVAVAHHLPAAQVTAIDLSAEALEIARQNAGKHSLNERIRFLHGDVFAPLERDDAFDLILSNPPYIPEDELDELPHGVRNYEPLQALDGGAGGFAVFDRIIHDAQSHLDKNSHLLLEIGAPQEESARRRIEQYTCYELAPTIRDMARHPRVLQARFLK